MAYESTISPILAMAALCAVAASVFLVMAVEVPAWGVARDAIHAHAQKLMLVVTGAAMAASLYYSEAVGFIPCEFCWYQRIAMYPLAMLLAIALVSRDRVKPRYIIALAGIGLCLSLYHYQMQLFPDQAGECAGPVSCAGRYVDEFGGITIPFMAGCAFLSVLLIQLSEWRVNTMFRRWTAAAVVPEGSGLRA